MQSIRRNLCLGHGKRIKYSSAHERRRAFTIIELVIVMLISSILAAAVAPKFIDSLLFHRVESAARRVKADLDMARQRARLSSAAQSVTFTNSTATYTIAGAKGLNNPNAVYTVNLKSSPFSLDSATANFGGAQTVSFDGYGTPASGGTVVLAAKTHQCTVSMEAITGTVTISSSHTGGRTAQVAGN